jgi:hypothetical protein
MGKDDDDDKYFLEKVIEELESEGEDLRHLGKKTWIALRLLATKIAIRLKTAVEKVLEALEEIADMFSSDK